MRPPEGRSENFWEGLSRGCASLSRGAPSSAGVTLRNSRTHRKTKREAARRAVRKFLEGPGEPEVTFFRDDPPKTVKRGRPEGGPKFFLELRVSRGDVLPDFLLRPSLRRGDPPNFPSARVTLPSKTPYPLKTRKRDRPQGGSKNF